MSSEKPKSHIKKAEQRLNSLLNYGGIYIDGSNHHRHLHLAYQDGDLEHEISLMRELAKSFNKLADELESVK